jgi:hypothetical protein
MEAELSSTEVWHAGEIVPAGAYLRLDDDLRRIVVLEQRGALPPGFDGRIALYCRAAPRLSLPLAGRMHSFTSRSLAASPPSR